MELNKYFMCRSCGRKIRSLDLELNYWEAQRSFEKFTPLCYLCQQEADSVMEYAFDQWLKARKKKRLAGRQIFTIRDVLDGKM